ncbi:MAG: purine-nucleoside phosphorylase [Legionella sp.]
MPRSTNAHLAAAYIQQLSPNFKPKIGIVLGSGLGDFARELDNIRSISFRELAGFPQVTVLGHSGNLVLGQLFGVDVVCLQGRAHTYEGLDNYQTVKTYIRTLKLLGCEYFIATNASGSLRADVGPGELMLVTDHINLQPSNPLIGPNDDDFGPRFLPLDKAYDQGMRENLLHIAAEHHIKLHQGVYLSVLGPNYETAAEIRAFRLWGADAVGMSTVPEVLVAHHSGMKVAVIATITNYATGLATSSHNHDEVVMMASMASKNLTILIKETVKQLQ